MKIIHIASFNGNIGDWDTSKVTTMRGFLLGATSFNADLFKWNVSNVRDWDEAFQDTPALTNCREVSNCDKSALNESVRLKACDNEVTLDVFHFDISALKAIASLAIFQQHFYESHHRRSSSIPWLHSHQMAAKACLVN